MIQFLLFVYLLFPAWAEAKSACSDAKACELVYSNCDCLAVAKGHNQSHEELFGKTEPTCKWNLCRESETKPICRETKCCRAMALSAWRKFYDSDSKSDAEAIAKLKAKKPGDWAYDGKLVFRCP
jgi:hypothetical protein